MTQFANADPAATAKPASLSTAERAYEEIRRQILSGELPEGAPIRQDEIAARIGVSKIPVREALMRLQSEGWVSLRRNAGAFVTPLTVNDCVEMLDMRVALECRALELAVPNMAPSDLALAEALLKRYAKADTPQSWSDLNLAFHQALYAPANRPRLVATAQAAQERMGRFLRAHLSAVNDHQRSTDEHIAIHRACAAGDTKTAVRLLRKHLEQTQREVMAFFRLSGKI
ncbi:GntR family transcriptional regulator [Pandoraea faecigallinarum]|uniref:GntR family transcriptional regulator n=1 Tax=Pandoraea faecigallinarum TaxID=656179 RepID=A0A0H3WS76_9BURK|nr:GntR family transcriptional regulator [Pandoraea faecigallinarum]AKM31054.1 GntR family transcriptional regulator [Pandoraea faecigallinarum]